MPCALEPFVVESWKFQDACIKKSSCRSTYFVFKNNLEAFNVESHIFAEKKELDSLHGDCNDDNGQIEIFTVLCSHSIKREISY